MSNMAENLIMSEIEPEIRNNWIPQFESNPNPNKDKLVLFLFLFQSYAFIGLSQFFMENGGRCLCFRSNHQIIDADMVG